MKGLIERKTAIELVRDVCDAIMSGCDSHWDGEDEVYEDIKEVDAILKCNKEIRTALKNMPSVQRWIPVIEALPEDDTEVLVTVHFLGLEIKHKTGWNDHIKPNYYVDVATYFDGEWSSCSDEYKVAKDRHKVIAWMPMIEPYKEKIKL